MLNLERVRTGLDGRKIDLPARCDLIALVACLSFISVAVARERQHHSSVTTPEMSQSLIERTRRAQDSTASKARATRATDDTVASPEHAVVVSN